MSTPTPIKHAPSQQGRTPSQLAAATPPVSTPFSNPAHTAFSPHGPRSSPQQVKKSPATSALMAQPPMPFNFDSPSTAAAMGALGIGAGFDIGLDSVAVGGLDGLGVTLAGDDDKLKRLDAMLGILNQSKGHVSEAGLERLAQGIGLELLSEEQTTLKGRKTKALAIAGSAIAFDIVLENNIVLSTSLTYHGTAPSVSKHMDAANQILLNDLQLLPDQSLLNKALDSFAANFEPLAMLDKLSIIPGLDCHEALAGIYVSLERLHQWDMSKLREEPDMADKPDKYLIATAMCTRQPVPVIHARGRVGLALQYWKELRFAPPRTEALVTYAEKHDKVFSLRLGCAPIDGLGIAPVRVSDSWISNDIVKADSSSIESGSVALDWQEPDNMSLPHSEDTKHAGMDVLQPDLSTTRVPRVTFTVTFDPPVILPQNDWSRLYMCAGLNPPNVGMATKGFPPTFDTLLYPMPPGTSVDPSEPRAISRRCKLPVFLDNRSVDFKNYKNTLFIYKPIYSQVVSEMPFSHPRQLVNMLPLLRQYAFLSTLLENSFGSKTKEVENSDSGKPELRITTIEDQLARIMGSSEPAEAPRIESEPESSLDVILWVHPSPHLQVVFPLWSATANITLKILEGGRVEILDENIIDRDWDPDVSGRRKKFSKEKLGKVLECLENLGSWAEWIRTRLA